MMDSEKDRIYFLDNLRTFLIFLVVLFHSGAVYESNGLFASFWIVDDLSTNKLVDIVNLLIDIFILPTLFFIAGYAASLSFKNKNSGTFLKDKFKRLMVPWLIAVFTLMPVYKMIFLYSRNLPQENWITYFHFNNGILSQSWLWFLPALFFFNTLYIPLQKFKLNISFKKAVFFVFLTGLAYSMLISISGAIGWTKTFFLDFQNERLLIYFLFFSLGANAYRNRIFEAEIKNKKLYYVINSILWIPINIYVFFLIFLFTNQTVVSVTFHKFVLYLGLHISLLGLVYVAIETFRYYFNKKGNIWQILNQNSYGVYIIHVIIIGLIALTMLNTGIPSLWKYIILIATSYSVSNLCVYFYKKIFKTIV